MTTFEDGPAKGQTLMLHRAARFLRVTFEAIGEGKWDALDQPEDEPRKGEQLYAYEIKELPGHCHINAGRGRGGFYPIATYRFVPEQPHQIVMQDSDAWYDWCKRQPPRSDLTNPKA